MGFKKEGRYYVPVTILKEDIRDLITNQERIIAILSKSINCELYTNIHYSPKNVDNVDNIPDTIIKMIDIENLIYDFEEKHIQTNPFLQSLIRQISSAKDL